eukprot:CAMPEP_0206052016 /NCGR_PEP_ID=MMETSP1466-20131121/32809_1 /ASSEMBLY_ACC=CAM_ASM_001126 /TAXON_ID=44452 /ORGANISM="Pavlova gyrans, Strain CCMP608" /LENGTH=359 /DNA_ID=CAMNT_0053427157 /DNA_START=53 /DNA_END=1132 /DNA_ORIENTATION=-
MEPTITERMMAPAQALLAAGPGERLCCVLTSAQAPHVIQAVDDAWCQTWQLAPHEAIGKTLNVIAGPGSSNASVSERLTASASDGKILDSWVDCGTVTNYAKRSLAPVHHHLAIGPARDASGKVCGLLGVSHVVGPPPAAPGRDKDLMPASDLGVDSTPGEMPTFSALLEDESIRQTLSSAMSSLLPAASSASSPRVGPGPRLFSPRLRRRLSADKPKRQHASTPASPTSAPPAPLVKRRMPPASPRTPAGGSKGSYPPSPPRRAPESLVQLLFDQEVAQASEARAIFSEFLDRSDCRIALRQACANTTCTTPPRSPPHARPAVSSEERSESPTDHVTFKRTGREVPPAPLVRRRFLGE